MSGLRSKVYVIEARGGLIKVGCSFRPIERLSMVRTHSPLPVRLYALWLGDLADEKEAHQRLRAHRSHNEWFRVEGEALNFMVEVRGLGVTELIPWEQIVDPDNLTRKEIVAKRIRDGNRKRWADPEWRRARWIDRRRMRLAHSDGGPAGLTHEQWAAKVSVATAQASADFLASHPEYAAPSSSRAEA